MYVNQTQSTHTHWHIYFVLNVSFARCLCLQHISRVFVRDEIEGKKRDGRELVDVFFIISNARWKRFIRIQISSIAVTQTHSHTRRWHHLDAILSTLLFAHEFYFSFISKSKLIFLQRFLLHSQRIIGFMGLIGCIRTPIDSHCIDKFCQAWKRCEKLCIIFELIESGQTVDSTKFWTTIKI